MESLNKFKVLTICVVAMFVFTVAAIYSNTKDVSMDKSVAKTEDIDKNTSEITDISQLGEDDYANQIKVLNGRIDELNERINKTVETQASNLKCRVMGIMTKDGLVELSADEVVQEAKANGNDIIVSCSL
jgi:TolA-binding protein